MNHDDKKFLSNKIKYGFTGSDLHTLWTNMHQRVEEPFLTATHFQKIKIGKEVKYDICDKSEKKAKKLVLGEDITMDDIITQKFSRNAIANEIQKIKVNEDFIELQSQMMLAVNGWGME